MLYCQDKMSKDFYTHFQNFVAGQIRQSKKYYFDHKFNAARNDKKQTWIIISNRINIKKCKVQKTL